MKRFLICVAVFVVVARSAHAQTSTTVFSLQGSATVVREAKEIPVSEGMALQPGDEVLVGDPGRLALQLNDGSYIRLAGGSRMTVPGDKKEVGLLQGAMHFFSHSEQHPTVVTEHVTAAIRGTEFSLTTNKANTTINMFSGSVQGSGDGGMASLSAGQGARFAKGKAPEVYALLSSDRSVQWSAFIPFMGDGAELGVASASPEGKALDLVEQGRVKEALRLLPKEKEACKAASVIRARILASSGDMKGASEILTKCSSPSSSKEVQGAAASSLSLLSLMQGDGDRARELSNAALSASPGSASARFARSLALQEQGDLEGALAIIETGDQSDPTIIARRAEILFMFGRVPEAREILEKMPNRSWYADTVLGFVLMGDRSFEDAEAAFRRATAAEPGAGLPQVGLGIVEVNKGNLESGRAYFERATVLEPSRSLYRSYLAKSYFESDNYDPAEPEYARAIELDPNDPTPHLYRSFMRLAQNQPVAALSDLETARDLSQKRDVYRSSFLLDEDSAVQSASLSRVYRDLGFERRGRIEAISAIYDDYENSSAHRLLSETEDNVVGAAASVSERRIADLFAPLSINVVDSIGTSVSLNEYSSLFERDGWRTGVSAGYRSYDDQFESGVLSANKSGNVVTGLSASGVVSDGLADDPRTSDGRVGISFQAQPSWADRFLVEARGSFFDNNQTAESENNANGAGLISYLHRFSPDTTAVVQSAYRRGRDRVTYPQTGGDIYFFSPDGLIDELVPATFDQTGTYYETAVENEAQLIDRTGRVTSILTGRFATYDTERYDHSLALSDDYGILDDLGVEFSSKAPINLQSSGVDYLSTVDVARSLKLNLGGNYSHVEFTSSDSGALVSDSESNSKLTPKAGIVYRPGDDLMIRVGYGETLGRSAQGSLASIEPTLIGGINQRITDVTPGTLGENFGVGIDLHPVRSTYFGGEWQRRWLSEPRVASVYEVDINPEDFTFETTTLSQDRIDVSVDQDLATAYLYNIVTEALVLGTDYRYTRSVRSFPDDSSLIDHASKSFARYFFTNMFFVHTAATYRYQDRENSIIGIEDGSSAGWLFDAYVGYRLPTRQGMITAGVKNIFGQDFTLDQYSYTQEIVINDPVFELAAKVNF